MSHVEVRQIGHVAVSPKVETFSLNGRSQTKALVTVMSNTRWKGPEGKVQERTTHPLDLVGVGRAECELVPRYRERDYTSKEGKEVFAVEFTARSVEYLEPKVLAEARRDRRAVAASERATTPARNPTSKPARSAASTKGA